MATWVSTLFGCAHAEPSLGMTLLFLNMGGNSILVERFDPDGHRGPVPGFLGSDAKLLTPERGGGAQMSFMSGDSKRGAPEFVDVVWSESTPQAEAALSRIPKLSGKVSVEQQASRKKLLDDAYRLRNNYTRRIDLTPILTPELVTQVRANRANTNLKLMVVFKGEDVTITASPEVWRK
ncbi:hypothetical protein EYS42_07140 [Aquabacterium lacunae]|uniref:Uncharacterized protein n=1 Tax=Aquabacterium lacunae TaxID=2528630 RepID=A0A4Q9H0V2_9BURK|nr:hypothetical protein [Aquabacterium lacunae]TBO32929.1 hypothetical protein EYS42_07140 [Aquabacterium lacunae]